MNTAVYAHPKAGLSEKSLLPGKMPLFDKLRERDIEPVVSLNAESAFLDNEVEFINLLAKQVFNC